MSANLRKNSKEQRALVTQSKKPLARALTAQLQHEGLTIVKTKEKLGVEKKDLNYLCITELIHPPKTKDLAVAVEQIVRLISRVRSSNGKVVVLTHEKIFSNVDINGDSYGQWHKKIIKTIETCSTKQKIDTRYLIIKDLILPITGDTVLTPHDRLLLGGQFDDLSLPTAEKIAPLFISDSVPSILKSIFSNTYKNKKIKIKANRSIKINALRILYRDVLGENSIESPSLKRAKAYLPTAIFSSHDALITIPAKTGLRQELVNIIKNRTQSISSKKRLPAINPADKQHEKKESAHRFKFSKHLLLPSLIMLIIASISALAPVGNLLIIAKYVEINRANLSAGLDYSTLHQRVGNAHNATIAQARLVNQLGEVVGISLSDNVNQQLTNLYHGIRFSLYLDEAEIAAQRAVSLLLASKGLDPRVEIKAALNALTQSLDQLQQIAPESWESSLQQGGIARFTERYTDLSQQSRDLKATRKLLEAVIALLDENPDPKIAVILQDHQELRPSGGFIDAVLFLDFSNRHLASFNLMSSAELDQKLRGQVQPPASLALNLKEKSWFLRDANWNPDFAESGRQIEFFIKEETSQNTDVIIATNTILIDQLTTLMSQKESDENTIYPDSLSSKLVKISQDLGIDAVDARKAAYASSINTLMAGLGDLSQSRSNLLPAIIKGGQEKNIVLYASKQSVQKIFSETGWAGNVIDAQCGEFAQARSCLADMTYLVDTNIAVNKGNDSVIRQHEHQVTLETAGAKIVHSLTISNQAQSTSWPFGSYKTLLRWYIPKNSSDIKIMVGEEELNWGEYKVTVQENHRLIDYAALIPVRTSQKISIIYRLKQKQQSGQDLRYVYVQQKQPGTTADTLKFSFNSNELPYQIQPNFDATIQNNKMVVAEQIMERDRIFSVELKP